MQFTKIAALLSLAVAITASPISLDASLYKNVALPGAVPALPVGVPALRSLPIEVPTLPVGIPTLPVGVPTLAKLPIHVRGIPVPVDSASLLNVLKITQVDIQPALSKLAALGTRASKIEVDTLVADVVSKLDAAHVAIHGAVIAVKTGADAELAHALTFIIQDVSRATAVVRGMSADSVIIGYLPKIDAALATVVSDVTSICDSVLGLVGANVLGSVPTLKTLNLGQVVGILHL